MIGKQRTENDEHQTANKKIDGLSNNVSIVSELFAFDTIDDQGGQHHCTGEFCEIVWKPKKKVA
jgi:hypothetical protein